MTIPSGTHFGAYEILTPLGSGGMGDVYRARDTKLQRDVALKVLTARIESDPDAIARFHREARAIAALNHPHIVTIHAVEEIDGRVFLAMELIDGRTLADLVVPGGAALDLVLKYAVPLADALGAAHAQGITHRDLKPANVMVTKDGRVKVLDFGLAKLRGELIEFDATMAPARPLTGRGQIVGTVAYMSPEQASGAAVDHRTDLFSFGVMLYELSSGERPFTGDSSVSVLAAILKDTPKSVTELRPDLPRDFARIVRRALAKDPEQRYQSAKDLRNDLQTLKDDLTSGDLSASKSATAAAATRSRRGWRPAISIPIVAAAVAAIIGASASRLLTTSAPLQPVRFDLPPPRGSAIPRFADTYTYASVSPDGSRIAFLASAPGSSGIWLKALDRASAELVPGTRGAESPFWSPDGRTIAFFADDALKKKSLDGGPPQTICPAPSAHNGTWNVNGTILFAEWGTRQLMRVSADGGAPVVERSGPDEYHWPQFLPDGRHYLFGKLERENGLVPRAFVGVLDSPEAAIIPGVSSRTEYANGNLFFWRDGALLAQPFDTRAFKLMGEARQIAEAVHGFSITGFAAFSAAPSLLVYQAGATLNRLAWFDRQGRELETVGAPMEYTSAHLSPDGSSVALSVRDQQLGTADIWIQDLKRNIARHFTNEKGTEQAAVWTPDGRTLVYAADRHGPPHIHARDVNGGDERQVVAPLVAGPQIPTAITPDGRSVLFTAQTSDAGMDIFIAPLDATGPPVPLVHAKGNETGAKMSRDGRWLAYVSDESGRQEVYVRPFQDDHSRAQVSRAGGRNIHWRADGREIFYAEGTRVMAADVTGASTFEASAPRVVFTAPGPFGDFDVSADGQRFLLLLIDREAQAGTLSAILNWPPALKRN